MPKSVTHITKLVGISAVELEGKLEYISGDRDEDYPGWCVVQRVYGKEAPKTDKLEEWLEKFSGKYVNISITILGDAAKDERHLLPEG